MANALDTARRHRPRVEAAADAIEASRGLTPDLIEALAASGVFRQLVPRQYGGLGVGFVDYLAAIECYAGADASTAWCINQGAVIGTTSMWLEPDAIRAIWATPGAVVANGPPLDCVLRRDGDAFRLTGRWGFSSGSRHATWMTGAARLDSGGWRAAFFPKTQATLHDTWQVAGLRGTGSFEFSVADLEVAPGFVADLGGRPHDDGVFYRTPTGLAFAVSFAAVALGVARAAIDSVVAIARDKRPLYASRKLRDEPDAQARIGESEVRWRAAHAYLFETVAAVCDALGRQDAIADDQRIALRMAGTHAMREAASALDLVWNVAGASGIYSSHPLQRRFQDMHVITQHVQARTSWYGYAGRYLMGHAFERGPLN
jgi:alkylation response protein AidB-like acyl-CoA dehydrogenase